VGTLLVTIKSMLNRCIKPVNRIWILFSNRWSKNFRVDSVSVEIKKTLRDDLTRIIVEPIRSTVQLVT
jgi:hypothetical protein